MKGNAQCGAKQLEAALIDLQDMLFDMVDKRVDDILPEKIDKVRELEKESAKHNVVVIAMDKTNSFVAMDLSDFVNQVAKELGAEAIEASVDKLESVKLEAEKLAKAADLA